MQKYKKNTTPSCRPCRQKHNMTEILGVNGVYLLILEESAACAHLVLSILLLHLITCKMQAQRRQQRRKRGPLTTQSRTWSWKSPLPLRVVIHLSVSKTEIRLSPVQSAVANVVYEPTPLLTQAVGLIDPPPDFVQLFKVYTTGFGMSAVPTIGVIRLGDRHCQAENADCDTSLSEKVTNEPFPSARL
jgi:hypothetical protein